MSNFKIFLILFVLFGIYKTFSIRKDYKKFKLLPKNTKDYILSVTFIRSFFIVLSSIIILFLLIFRWNDI